MLYTQLSKPDFVLEALFKNSQLHKKILDTLAKKHYGLRKNDLEALTSIPTAGTLTSYLDELQACGPEIWLSSLGSREKKIINIID